MGIASPTDVGATLAIPRNAIKDHAGFDVVGTAAQPWLRSGHVYIYIYIYIHICMFAYLLMNVSMCMAVSMPMSESLCLPMRMFMPLSVSVHGSVSISMSVCYACVYVMSMHINTVLARQHRQQLQRQG
jgi:hypothetical protein